MNPRLTARTALAALMILASTQAASAQTFGSDFNSYSLLDLGAPAGLSGNLGGLTLKAGDPNTLLIGGWANTTSGEILEVPLLRDATGHIVGFGGPGTFFASAPQIDGGLAYGPGGVLLFTKYSNNEIGQILPGSTAPDKTVPLNPLGVCGSVGALGIVPAGMPGAGLVKVASFSCPNWYDVTLVPDGSGTFDVSAATLTTSAPQGPEGIVWVPAGNTGFTQDSALVCEYGPGRVRAFDLDAQGNPVTGTGRDFVTGLSGALGAFIDPLTGDFLFSTYGGSQSRVIVVSGFGAPTVYCQGKQNSAGCVPSIVAAGTASFTGPDDFVVSSSGATNHSVGALFWSATPSSTPFGGGTLCLTAPPLVAFPRADSGGNPGTASDCSGAYSTSVTQAWMNANGLVPGTEVFMQYLSRDPGFAGAAGIGLSDAMRFSILP